APRDALRGHGGVELEGGEAPGEALRLRAQPIECGEPARRADVAPRSDDVGPQQDFDHVLSPCGAVATAADGVGSRRWLPRCGRSSPARVRPRDLRESWRQIRPRRGAPMTSELSVHAVWLGPTGTAVVPGPPKAH